MSTLPKIDQVEASRRATSKISEALNSKLLEAILQIAQLEVLAEALRDERDQYQKLFEDSVAERATLEELNSESAE